MKRFKMYRVLTFFFLLLHLGCKDTSSPFIEETPKLIEEVIPNLFYGIDLNKYDVDTQKIRRGDTFGKILEDKGIDYPDVYKILQAIKGKVSIRKLTIGKPYSIFYSKDSISTPEFFVYHPSAQSYTRIHLRDSLYGEEVVKPLRLVELEASGIIESSLYETMQNSGINEDLTYYLSDIYAWTIDFFRLQKD